MAFSYGNNNDSDILNFNMLKICDELSVLIGNETDVIASSPVTNLRQQSMSSDGGADVANRSMLSVEVIQELQVSTCVETVEEFATVHETIPPIAQDCLFRTYEGKANMTAPSPMGISQKKPQFEFQYLAGFNKTFPAMESAPLLSNAAVHGKGERYGNRAGYGAAQRKHQRPTNGKGRNGGGVVGGATPNNGECIIGLDEDGKERNLVLRVFHLLYEMHYYMNDVLPSADAMTTLENISLVPPVRASMPSTMNVQFQVKQAARKCMIYICDQERIINANKLLDREMYEECEGTLRDLRRTLTQFEIYKKIELEHKRGRFVTDLAKAQAEHLEGLLQKLNDLIREANVVVHVFNWAVAKKFNRPPIYRPLQIPSLNQKLIVETSHPPTVACKASDLFFQIIREVTAAKQVAIECSEQNKGGENFETMLRQVVGMGKEVAADEVHNKAYTSYMKEKDVAVGVDLERDTCRFVG